MWKLPRFDQVKTAALVVSLMATGVTLGYNFRTVDVNSKAIVELKAVVAAIPVAHDYLTLAQFNEFKDAQETDRKWMIDAIFNLHKKFDYMIGSYTIDPPAHDHPNNYDPGDVMRMTYVTP